MKRLCLAILLLVAMSSYAYAATCTVHVIEMTHYYFIDPETGRYTSHISPVERPPTKYTITRYDIAGDVDVNITHTTMYRYVDGDLALIKKITQYQDTSPLTIVYTSHYFYENGVMYDSEHFYEDSDSSDN